MFKIMTEFDMSKSIPVKVIRKLSQASGLTFRTQAYCFHSFCEPCPKTVLQQLCTLQLRMVENPQFLCFRLVARTIRTIVTVYTYIFTYTLCI